VRANSGFAQLPSGLFVPLAHAPESVTRHIDRMEALGISRRAVIAGMIQAVQANDSITVTPGSGATLATHSAGSKEHQVVMVADQAGHILGSKNIYFALIPSQVHVNSANTVHWDLFNADAALLVRVLSILQIPNITTAVTGVVFDWLLERTTSVGTGGTGITPWLPDTGQTALDADITCRSKPSGGAGQGTDLRNYSLSSEETNAATIQIASQGGLELIPASLLDPTGPQGILLRQNEGLRCVQITASAAGNTGWLIALSVE
jgi:hypothetical protein